VPNFEAVLLTHPLLDILESPGLDLSRLITNDTFPTKPLNSLTNYFATIIRNDSLLAKPNLSPTLVRVPHYLAQYILTMSRPRTERESCCSYWGRERLCVLSISLLEALYMHTHWYISLVRFFSLLYIELSHISRATFQCTIWAYTVGSVYCQVSTLLLIVFQGCAWCICL